MSLEPYPQRRRRNPASGFQPGAAGTLEIDPPVGVIDSQDRPSTSRELERNTLVLSRVIFQSEDNIKVEELSESIVAPNSPLPLDHLDILLYIGTSIHKPSSLGLFNLFL